MKRKVAAMGRQSREFSWSMSVEPGERCLPKHKTAQTYVGATAWLSFSKNPGLCSEWIQEDLCGTKSVFFRGCKETHGAVL